METKDAEAPKSRTILDYLETERASFEEKPFNEIDSLILSRFCSVRLEHSTPWQQAQSGPAPEAGLRFSDVLRAEDFPGILSGTTSPDLKQIVYALAASPRFRNVRVCRYRTVFDEKVPTQFGAMTFVIAPDLAFIGFRGTDATLAGWHEDFNLGYMHPVPAQREAAAYLEEVAGQLPGTLLLGGHSKGGNLAQFAVLNASGEVRRRVEHVWCHDSPGFREGALSERDAMTLRRLVDKTVPQDSVVGMLLSDPSPRTVIRSNAKGFEQHMPTTWEVNEDGTGFLPHEEGLSQSAQFASDVIDEWIAGYDECDVPMVVGAVFNLLESIGLQDLSGSMRDGTKMFALLRDAATSSPRVSRAVVLDAVARLAEVAAKKMMSEK